MFLVQIDMHAGIVVDVRLRFDGRGRFVHFLSAAELVTNIVILF